jgi:hypothetical protein
MRKCNDDAFKRFCISLEEGSILEEYVVGNSKS